MWTPPRDSYALALCTYFWMADVFSKACGAVTHGGLIAWETFALARGADPPRHPERYLTAGQPASLLPAGFEVLDQHDIDGHGKPARRMIARRRIGVLP
jgi:hypothetical protein